MFTIDTIPFHTCKTLPLFNIYFDFHHWNHHKRTDIRIEKPWNSYYQVNDRPLPPIRNPGAYPLWCPRTYHVFSGASQQQQVSASPRSQDLFPRNNKRRPFFSLRPPMTHLCFWAVVSAADFTMGALLCVYFLLCFVSFWMENGPFWVNSMASPRFMGRRKRCTCSEVWT